MLREDDVEIYPKLLNFYYEVVNSLKDSSLKDERMKDCENFAMKLFMHATTVQGLRNGTNITLAAFPKGANIADFASIFAIVRASIETYINMAELYFEALSPDEFEYRYCVHRVRGLRIWEQHLPTNPDADTIKQVEQSIKEIDSLRSRIKSTSLFTALDKNQQKSTVEGYMFPKRTFSERAQAAGLGSVGTSKMYAFLSAYAHGDALSIIQISGVDNDEDKRRFIRTAVATMIMLLCLVIVNYADRFPQAKAVCDQRPAPYRYAKTIAKQAANL